MRKLIVILILALSPLFAGAATLPDRVAFSHAVETNNLFLVRGWLENGLSPDFEGRIIGTGLMIAAWEGNIPMMELFLAHGADVNKTNSLGEQALLHAAWKGRLEAVRWLVEHGARLDRNGKEWAALHYAAFAGHEDVVRYLIERGADVNALSTNGSTPLMMAAREGKEEIAGRLLSAGARGDVVNDWGDNAVTWAMRHNNLRIAQQIAGDDFARLAARPAASFGQAVRSQAVPDRVDALFTQAQKAEAAGRRADALKIYRAALAAVKQAEARKTAAAKAAPEKARAVSGMTITARRADPNAQSAGLQYQTPATDPAPATAARATAKVGAGGTATAAAAGAASGTPTETVAESWLRRARELEAAGKRQEALAAYRQASSALRGR